MRRHNTRSAATPRRRGLPDSYIVTIFANHNETGHGTLPRFENSRTSKPLAIAAPPQESLDLVMVAKERDEKLRAAVLKDKPQIAIAAAFKKLRPQFADTEATVHVRLAIALHKIAESKKAFYPFILRECAQPANNRGRSSARRFYSAMRPTPSSSNASFSNEKFPRPTRGFTEFCSDT